MTTSEAEEVDVEDPFSDRKHGPRTRARAHKEEEEVQTDHEKRVGKRKHLFLKNLPTYASFAKLEPAAFPSLDPTLSIKETEEILYEREIKRRLEREISPFYADVEGYFAEDQDLRQNSELLASRTLSQQGERDFETTITNSHGTGLFRPRAGPDLQETIVENSIQYYNRTGQHPYRYKTFLTKHLASGKIVRWHQRASSKESEPVLRLDGTVQVVNSPRPSQTPGLDSDSGSDSGSDNDKDLESSHVKQIKSEHPLLGEFLKRKRTGGMAENAAPIATNDDATRGMPYYDRLKKTLKASIKQKQDLEDTLTKIEQSIWNKEAAYLDDTVAGNIMKGFDNYIKASGAPGGSLMGGGTASRKKATVSEQDRLFSRSSVGFWSSMSEGSPHASATSTPSHAPTPKGLSDHPTPTSTTSTKAPGWKKKKAAEKDDESDGKPPNKRLKITFSRTDKD